MSSKSARSATALLLATAATTLTIHAADPVVVWDGAAEGYKFDTLTRTVGDNTYTLTVNQNTVASDNSYIQIANANQLKGVVLSAVNTDTSVTNAFGTAGALSVIMKVNNCYVSDSANRMLIGLMDGNLYKDGGTSAQDNGAVIGFCGYGTTSRLVWKGGTYSDSSVQVADALTANEMTVALTYSATGGTVSYVDSTVKSSSSGLKWGAFTTPCGIMLGGLDVDGSGTFYGMRGMQIKALAVFTSTLSAAEVAAYTAGGFPSASGKIVLTGDSTVSAINTQAGDATEITVFVPAGYTVYADTQYTATTVNFESNGEYYIFPPENNAANLVNKAGKLIMMYTSVPSVSGTYFTSNSVPTTVTDSSSWTNTVCLKGVAFTDFETNPYGNESSVVRLEGCSGWVKAPAYVYTNSVPLDIKGTLTLNNGNSTDSNYPRRGTLFNKVTGNGTILGNSSANTVVILIKDYSEFTGNVQLTNKIVVFGDTLPNHTTLAAGTIIIESGNCVTNNGYWWAVNGIDIYGELCAPALGGSTVGFGDTTTNKVYDTGVFTLTSTANVDDSNVDYSRITGTGTLQYKGTGYRAISTNNFPTTVTFRNEQSGDTLVPLATTYTIGSLAGSCKIQGNSGQGNHDRYLRVLQSKDTEWSGIITADGYERFAGMYVAPGDSTAGTLTLSGTQTQPAFLNIETNGSVNLTGAWAGPVTVYGSLSGTGSIVTGSSSTYGTTYGTGDLVLTDDSSLVISDISDMLTISGSLTATGSISIYLPAGTDPKDVAGKVISAGSTPVIDGASFSIYIGDTLTGMLKIRATSEGLKFGSNFGTVIRLM